MQSKFDLSPSIQEWVVVAYVVSLTTEELRQVFNTLRGNCSLSYTKINLSSSLAASFQLPAATCITGYLKYIGFS